MDCPCEENLIRMKLQPFDSIVMMDFDLNERRLTIFHRGEVAPLELEIASLGLGSELLSTEMSGSIAEKSENKSQRRTLWVVLIINLLFFLLEGSGGIVANSMGLLGDSLDMLADSLVYGMSLLAVGATVFRKKQVALLSGYLQIFLAAIGFLEVLKRFAGHEMLINAEMMMGMAFLSLLANVVCLRILQSSRSEDPHMRASVIFSSNDILINAGVILAGILTHFTHSIYPDLFIGIVVFLLVMKGAFRILKLAK